MRSFPPAILLCVALASAGGAGLIAFAAHGGSPGKAPAAAAAPSAAPKPATSPTAGGNVDNDAPARHAKRTACLKDAKSKKLIGARRAAFVKSCIGTP